MNKTLLVHIFTSSVDQKEGDPTHGSHPETRPLKAPPEHPLSQLLSKMGTWPKLYLGSSSFPRGSYITCPHCIGQGKTMTSLNSVKRSETFSPTMCQERGKWEYFLHPPQVHTHILGVAPCLIISSQYQYVDLLNDAPLPGIFNNKCLVPDFPGWSEFTAEQRKLLTTKAVQICKASGWPGGDS